MVMVPKNERKAENGVNNLFVERWSPRALDPSPIPEDTLKTLFEAARWSPSCFNGQPWLFMYGTSPEEHGIYLEILLEGNRVWAKNAPVLSILFAKKRFDHDNSPNRWAVFDCGAAWMSLALQARMLGLYSHAMAGFSKEKAHRLLNVPESDYEAVCAIAIGKYGIYENLPEKLREQEKPNDRKALSESIRKGIFK